MASQLTDLSLQGTFLRSFRWLEPGTRVEIDVVRGRHRNPLRMRAEVARVARNVAGDPQGFGLRFVEVTPADEIALQGILAGA